MIRGVTPFQVGKWDKLGQTQPGENLGEVMNCDELVIFFLNFMGCPKKKFNKNRTPRGMDVKSTIMGRNDQQQPLEIRIPRIHPRRLGKWAQMSLPCQQKWGLNIKKSHHPYCGWLRNPAPVGRWRAYPSIFHNPIIYSANNSDSIATNR